MILLRHIIHGNLVSRSGVFELPGKQIGGLPITRDMMLVVEVVFLTPYRYLEFAAW